VSAMPPGGQPHPFTPRELDGAPGVHADEVAGNTVIARTLERLASTTPVTPSPAFTERVMGAIASEPAPAPARLAGLALRRRSPGAFLLSLRDAWQVMTRSGFPVAARAQAMALVLVVAALATGSGMVTAGALGLFDGDHATPSPSIEQPSEPADASTEPSNSAEPSEDGSASPDASASEEPSETAGDESAEPDASTEPTESADDHGGSGGGGGGDSATPRPTRTPSPTSTDHEDHTSTPRPSDTPHPSDTPKPED
jgi:negative regulator of sigma E activity